MKRLYVDGITRNTHPREYAQVILELAKEGIGRGLGNKGRRTAAMFCGYPSWDQLQDELTTLESSDPTRAVELTNLLNAGLGAAATAEYYSLQACSDPFHFEVSDPESPDGPQLRVSWLSSRETGEVGLYRFSTATTIGDRSFTLHFDSQFFPELEAELVALQALKEEYWLRDSAAR